MQLAMMRSSALPLERGIVVRKAAEIVSQPMKTATVSDYCPDRILYASLNYPLGVRRHARRSIQPYLVPTPASLLATCDDHYSASESTYYHQNKMKASFFVTLSASVFGVEALLSLSEYAKNIPSCAHAAFRDAVAKEGCSTTVIDGKSFDCACSHVGAIAVLVQKAVPSDCSIDFTEAWGHFCGMWGVDSTTATDFAAATSVIGADFAGAGAAVAEATTTAAAGGTSASKNYAAIATIGPNLGLFGAAAVAALGW
ncbi:hypothetical protein JX265_007977 [Neoarthrinium moseri]|uniref:Uncharacterized protein n=1 Tax=Neoarthrinium moseri TaxID=1658444 RepID=A0A9P9WIY8_9PEZI|nr:hypothetical protein JX265_007977 [Neoarthrinium moseri]